MTARVKRTYNLAPDTVKRVREMADRYGVAPSQDAVIELAVDELERRLREQHEADAWERAAADPAFGTEVEALAGAYRSADRETWPA
jgi:predicted transcriptional regulator